MFQSKSYLLQQKDPIHIQGKSLTFSKVQEDNANYACMIKVDDSKYFQEILGLGYSFEHSSCSNLMYLDIETRKKVVKCLVSEENGAGMNLWRLCIGTSDFTGTEWYSYDDIESKREDLELEEFSIQNDYEFIIPIVKLAQKINPKIRFFASPWSPPAWMKDSKNMCGGKLLKKYYSVYADYLVKYIEEYNKIGIPILAITVQNEPGVNNEKMPSCQWTPNEERDFIKNFLGPAFQKANLKTKIWCYDHNFGFVRKITDYPQIVLSDKKTAQYIDGIAFHHYGGKPEYMRIIKKQFPKKKLYFTEGSIFKLLGARKLVKYFQSGVKSYNGWVFFLDTDGKPNNGPHRASKTMLQLDKKRKKVLVNFDYFIMYLFSKFIPRRAKMIYTHPMTKGRTNWAAFKSNEGEISLFIVNNSFKSKEIAINWRYYQSMFKIPRKSIMVIMWNTNAISS